mmetsp:Transcript_8451/g.28037  ORF Transcript_8451/g.28037 Transcript_8451/m.28037 type:complete len:89 (+) Transcript_8451:1-267(+)
MEAQFQRDMMFVSPEASKDVTGPAMYPIEQPQPQAMPVAQPQAMPVAQLQAMEPAPVVVEEAEAVPQLATEPAGENAGFARRLLRRRG